MTPSPAYVGPILNGVTGGIGAAVAATETGGAAVTTGVAGSAGTVVGVAATGTVVATGVWGLPLVRG